MKKLVSLLAVLLSLVMLAAPISAGAETLDMVALQISDPVVALNGQTVIDLSGLTLQLAGGANADMTLMQLFLDIIGGGNTVTSALVQLDENGLAGIIGGMSKAYGVPMETLTAMGDEIMASMGDVNAIMAESSATAEKLANWTLPQQLTELVSGYAQANRVVGENYTRDVALSTGAVSAEFESWTLDCTSLVPQIAALLDGDEIAMQLLAALNSEGAVYAESYTELLAFDGASFVLSAGIASGDAFTAEDMTLKMDNGDVINLTFSGITETTADGSRNNCEITMYPESEEHAGEEVYLTLDVTAGSIMTIAGHFGYNFGSDETYDLALMATVSDDSFNAMLSDTLGMVNASCSYVPGSLNITANMDGESMNAYCNWNAEGFSAGLSAGSAGSFDLAYVAEANDAYFFKGKLNLAMNDGYDAYSVSMGVGAVPGSVDTAATYIAPELVTDITTLDDEQAYAVEEEIMTILQNSLITLAQYVPGLQALIGG